MEVGNGFSRCLLDQKDEESRHARRLQRHTLLLSILIQVLILTLLVLRPLFGAQELPTMARLVPVPPWKGQPGAHASAPRRAAHHPVRHRDVTPSPILFYPVAHPVPHEESDGAPDAGSGTDSPGTEGPGDPTGLIPGGGPPGMVRPSPPPREVEARPRVVPPEIQQALLVVRVEPQYPVLAKQIHLEGTVQIRAVIGRDGSVQSAEILSGHLLLAQAARDAILRWRYRPTLLRGETIEVETLITVIFRIR